MLKKDLRTACAQKPIKAYSPEAKLKEGAKSVIKNSLLSASYRTG
jgi:hypothetical protein